MESTCAGQRLIVNSMHGNRSAIVWRRLFSASRVGAQYITDLSGTVRRLESLLRRSPSISVRDRGTTDRCGFYSAFPNPRIVSTTHASDCFLSCIETMAGFTSLDLPLASL